MSDIRTQALACRDAATAIAALDNNARRLLLLDMAQAIDSQTDAILAANEKDMAQAAAKGVQGAMLDRLRLDAGRVATIANAVREVADLPDPVGQVTRRDQLPNGLAIERVRIPLGVITMIYEARPNVTADAAALCLKAGNAVILRGGSDALHSYTAIAAALHAA
jgi:glutamate-5-semialdehyde dehydrogenase